MERALLVLTVLVVLTSAAASQTAPENLPESNSSIEEVMQEHGDLIVKYDKNMDGDISNQELVEDAISDWRQDEITEIVPVIKAWRYDGNHFDYVDPAKYNRPDATVAFNSSKYEEGETVILVFEAFQPGEFELEVSGAGIQDERTLTQNTETSRIEYQASSTGEVTARLVAPGDWWNPIDSDQEMAEDTVEIVEAEEEEQDRGTDVDNSELRENIIDQSSVNLWELNAIFEDNKQALSQYSSRGRVESYHINRVAQKFTSGELSPTEFQALMFGHYEYDGDVIDVADTDINEEYPLDRRLSRADLTKIDSNEDGGISRQEINSAIEQDYFEEKTISSTTLAVGYYVMENDINYQGDQTREIPEEWQEELSDEEQEYRYLSDLPEPDGAVSFNQDEYTDTETDTRFDEKPVDISLNLTKGVYTVEVEAPIATNHKFDDDGYGRITRPIEETIIVDDEGIRSDGRPIAGTDRRRGERDWVIDGFTPDYPGQLEITVTPLEEVYGQAEPVASDTARYGELYSGEPEGGIEPSVVNDQTTVPLDWLSSNEDFMKGNSELGLRAEAYADTPGVYSLERKFRGGWASQGDMGERGATPEDIHRIQSTAEAGDTIEYRLVAPEESWSSIDQDTVVDRYCITLGPPNNCPDGTDRNYSDEDGTETDGDEEPDNENQTDQETDTGDEENQETENDQESGNEEPDDQNQTDQGDETNTGDESRNETEPEDGTENQSQVNSLELTTEDAVTQGQEISFEVKVNEEISNSGYEVAMKGPDDGTKSFESRQRTASFQPNETGTYTFELRPSGMLSNIVGSLLGGEPLDTAEVEVVYDGAEWENYCASNGYDPENVQKAINCITNDIASDYFQDSVGENPEIADSVCQNLLGLSYNQDQRVCE